MMKLLSSSVHCFSSQASLYSENNLNLERVPAVGYRKWAGGQLSIELEIIEPPQEAIRPDKTACTS